MSDIKPHLEDYFKPGDFVVCIQQTAAAVSPIPYYHWNYKYVSRIEFINFNTSLNCENVVNKKKWVAHFSSESYVRGENNDIVGLGYFKSNSGHKIRHATEAEIVEALLLSLSPDASNL